MKKIVVSSIVIAICSIVIFSCKKTGKPESCFTMNKNTYKIGDTIYLLNCSKYYTLTKWYLTSPYPPIIDSSRLNHLKYVPTDTGVYNVIQFVGSYNFSKDSVFTNQTFTVIP